MKALIRRACLVVGSPRPRGRSTSESLARELMKRLQTAGVDCDLFYASSASRAGAEQEALMKALSDSELLVLASPIYVNSLPSPVTALLEGIGERFPRDGHLHMAALLNCGFPEAMHCHLAFRVCKAFCRRTGILWLGALEVGGGGVVDGRPLSDVGDPVKGLARGLDETAQALARGEPIPQSAREAASQPLLQPWLYRVIGNIGWLMAGIKAGTITRLWARPFRPKTR
ncbi:MAG: NAD(P)H-dependent oxidoreductase [Myxococcota bacterium]